jgi:hypothetical protein
MILIFSYKNFSTEYLIIKNEKIKIRMANEKKTNTLKAGIMRLETT